MPRKKPPTENAPGRPPRAGQRSTALIPIRVTPEEHATFTAAAAARGVTLADVVRNYLRRWAQAKR